MMPTAMNLQYIYPPCTGLTLHLKLGKVLSWCFVLFFFLFVVSTETRINDYGAELLQHLTIYFLLHCQNKKIMSPAFTELAANHLSLHPTCVSFDKIC